MNLRSQGTVVDVRTAAGRGDTLVVRRQSKRGLPGVPNAIRVTVAWAAISIVLIFLITVLLWALFQGGFEVQVVGG